MTRSFVIGLGLALTSGSVASAQDVSRYRVYALESTLEAVAAVSGVRATDAKLLHARPATLQELEWRAPYVRTGTTQADPVRTIVFRFYNDVLYQMVINYDRERTDGLTNKDVVESIATEYGVPAVAPRVSAPPEALRDGIVLARWESTDSVTTLVRGAYAAEFQLLVTSRTLSVRARQAAREAIRLDALEAPQREADMLKKKATDASAARSKARDANKAAFRP